MTNVEEKIAVSKSTLLYGSLIIAVWVALAVASAWLFNPLVGWLFLGFSAFSILIVLRRQLCNSCYYCKSCTKGFAKLSKLFLGSNNIPGIGKGSILGMATYIYVILMVIPTILLANSILQEFNIVKLLVLVGLLLFSTYNLVARAKNGKSR